MTAVVDAMDSPGTGSTLSERTPITPSTTAIRATTATLSDDDVPSSTRNRQGITQSPRPNRTSVLSTTTTRSVRSRVAG